MIGHQIYNLNDCRVNHILHHTQVVKERFELSRPVGHQGLNLARLPLRHFTMFNCATSQQARFPISRSLDALHDKSIAYLLLSLSFRTKPCLVEISVLDVSVPLTFFAQLPQLHVTARRQRDSNPHRTCVHGFGDRCIPDYAIPT